METLRDCQPSLLRTLPERDANVRAVGNGHTTTQIRSQEDPALLAEPVVLQPREQARPIVDVKPQDRFSRRYSDPLFPCKPVRYAIWKRLFDLLVASAAILVFSIPMLIVALLVKLTSRGPIIFRQTRVGRGGRYFWCYKFRSMCVDAEKQKDKLMHLNEVSGPVFKMQNDPRVTPIGKFIRKFSLDELPQLFNVIKGDMSVVGPRPPIPAEVEAYNERQRGRLAVLPGLTCLWQVSGRSNIGWERWVELDLLYIEEMSLLMDVKITCKTIPAVLSGSGAK